MDAGLPSHVEGSPGDAAASWKVYAAGKLLCRLTVLSSPT